MTVLRFQGICDADWESPTIGGRNVIEEINAVNWRDSKVTVGLGDETFDGELEAWEGSPGYSEWTPGDVPQLMVGEHDVWDRLDDLDGHKVTLWVADEPVNLLDQS